MQQTSVAISISVSRPITIVTTITLHNRRELMTSMTPQHKCYRRGVAILSYYSANSQISYIVHAHK